MYLVYEQCLDLGSIKGKRYYATEHDDLQALMHGGRSLLDSVGNWFMFLWWQMLNFKQYPDTIRVQQDYSYISELVKMYIFSGQPVKMTIVLKYTKD